LLSLLLMSDARRSQPRAVMTFAAVLLALGATFGACTSYQRANGEQCLKDVDCVSGYCIAQVCGSPNPALNGSSYGDGGNSGSTGNDGGGSMTSDDTGASSTPEAGTGSDASADGPGEKVDSSKGGDDASSIGDASNVNVDGDAAEMDASDDAPTDAPSVEDAADAQDAFNQLSLRRSFAA
jgi:hypothetical protein